MVSRARWEKRYFKCKDVLFVELVSNQFVLKRHHLRGEADQRGHNFVPSFAHIQQANSVQKGLVEFHDSLDQRLIRGFGQEELKASNDQINGLRQKGGNFLEQSEKGMVGLRYG